MAQQDDLMDLAGLTDKDGKAWESAWETHYLDWFVRISAKVERRTASDREVKAWKDAW